MIMLLSDVAGLIGGILLAIPPVHTQGVRDDRDILANQAGSGTEVDVARKSAVARLDSKLVRLARRDKKLVAWGACLLVGAFLLKVIGGLGEHMTWPI